MPGPPDLTFLVNPCMPSCPLSQVPHLRSVKGQLLKVVFSSAWRVSLPLSVSESVGSHRSPQIRAHSE